MVTHTAQSEIRKTPLRRAREAAPGSPSQAAIAAAAGLNQGYYSRVESGLIQPSPAVAERIAKLFGIMLTEEMILYPSRFAEESANV